jgi:hypothetical protein
MKLEHLRNKAIDFKRWDDCVAQSRNHLTYAFSWYLGVVSPDWEALVSKDYEYVMPLPVKSRYGFPYMVQPLLTQQLGIFSKHKITEQIVEEFMKEIPYFSYELNLNENNFYAKALIYPNFILDLNKPYIDIYSSYSKNSQRNIEKAQKSNLRIQQNITKESFLSFYFSVHKHYLSPQQPVLKKLIEKGISENALTLYGVFSDNNNLVAGLCMLHTNNRLTYLLPASNAEGRKTSAMFLLIDHLIRKNAEKNYLLDFEGSKIESIARLYRGFGAKYHPYYILKRFRPSFLIRK